MFIQNYWTGKILHQISVDQVALPSTLNTIECALSVLFALENHWISQMIQVFDNQLLSMRWPTVS